MFALFSGEKNEKERKKANLLFSFYAIFGINTTHYIFWIILCSSALCIKINILLKTMQLNMLLKHPVCDQ